MKSKSVATILAIFLGGLGFQWFYVGKVGKGILYLLTGGLLGIGWFISIFKMGHEVDLYNALHGYAGRNNNMNNNMNNIVVNVVSPTSTEPAAKTTAADAETK